MNTCITCYGICLTYVDGESVELCHICLTYSAELFNLDRINDTLESYTFQKNGFCEFCISNCSTVELILCNDHYKRILHKRKKNQKNTTVLI